MQDLTADEHLCACPQPLGLPTSGPGKSCHDDCTERRLVPGGGPADHPATHWGEVAHAGAHQVGHTQEERAPVEERCPPGMCQRLWGMPANLTGVLHVLRLLVPQAIGSPCPVRRVLLPIGWNDGTPRALLGAK